MCTSAVSGAGGFRLGFAGVRTDICSNRHLKRGLLRFPEIRGIAEILQWPASIWEPGAGVRRAKQVTIRTVWAKLLGEYAVRKMIP
jgi:hypothetical protein